MAGHRRYATLAVVAVCLAFALPLATAPYFPGLDVPWHAAAAEILHARDPARFLGAFDTRWQLGSYVTMYAVVDALAFVVGDTAVAMQLAIALAVAGFGLAALALSRAFGGSGLTAVLAVPAAYSLTLEFGFVTYAITYPLTLLLWAQCRRAVDAPGAWRAGAIALLAAAIALSHPFAAVVAAAGAVVVIASSAPSVRRAALALGALAIGIAPAVLAAASIGPGAGTSLPPAIAAGDLWTKLGYQVFSPVDVAVAAAPARLFGFVPVPWRFALVGFGLAAAVLARYLAGAHPARPRGRRTLGLLLLALVAIYLLTPQSFYWPRFWYVVQPRHLPLIWVVALTMLRIDDRAAHPVRASVPLFAVAGAALAVWIATAWVPFAAEVGDFRAAIAPAAPRVRTLALIEQPRARDDEPGGPFRHFGAYVVVARGGLVSHLPMTSGYTGALTPVVPARDAPAVPAAPQQGWPRTFTWERHAAGWDQFLIRDLDPAHRFDYFREHTADVELVARAGRWRLYRRSAR